MRSQYRYVVASLIRFVCVLRFLRGFLLCELAMVFLEHCNVFLALLWLHVSL